MNVHIIEKYRELLISGKEKEAEELRETVLEENVEMSKTLDVIYVLCKTFDPCFVPEGFLDRQMNLIESELTEDASSKPPKSLPEFLIISREKFGWDTLSIAQQLGCNWNFYVDLELGKVKKLQKKLYEKLSELFGKSTEYLMTLPLLSRDERVSSVGEYAYFRNSKKGTGQVKKKNNESFWTDAVINKASECLINWFNVESIKEISIPINVIDIGERILGLKIEFPKTIEGNASGAFLVNEKVIQILQSEKYLERQLFTYAHEMGHAVLHVDKSRQHFRCKDIHKLSDPTKDLKEGSYQRIEAEANLFASELLMPRDLVVREYVENGDHDVVSLAKKFQVSNAAMAWKLHRLRLQEKGDWTPLPFKWG